MAALKCDRVAGDRLDPGKGEGSHALFFTLNNLNQPRIWPAGIPQIIPAAAGASATLPDVEEIQR